MKRGDSLNWLAQGGVTAGAGRTRDGLVSGGLTYSAEDESCAGEEEASAA
jgi:hypothetical protein